MCHLPAHATAHGSEPGPDRSDVPTNAAWTTGSGCVEQAAHIRRPCYQRPSGSVALSSLVASVPIRCVRRSLHVLALDTQHPHQRLITHELCNNLVSLEVGTWHFGWIPGSNAWKRMRLSWYARYIVWCAWRRAATSLLCRLASDNHRCAVCIAIGRRYREKSQSSHCMPQKAQVSKILERLKIRSRWCRLEAIKPDV